MSIEWWLQKIQEGGAIAALLEFGALLWLNVDRNRLIAALKEKSEKVDNLSERLIIITTELKMFLFNERRP